MPERTVTRLRKLCGQLAGHSWEHAEKVAAAAAECVRPWMSEDQEMPDLEHFVLCLAEKLEDFRQRLTAIHNRHRHELQVDRNLRQARDGFAADTRERVLQLRNSLNGLYGAGGATRIFEDSAPIPIDPVALHQYVGHLRDNLGNPEFPMPEPLQEGFVLDREAAIRDFDAPFQRLGEVLRKLEVAQSASKHSQSLKDQEIAAAAEFTGRVGRFLESLFDLAGFDRLSGRLRRSSRRGGAAGSAAPGGDAPAGDTPGEIRTVPAEAASLGYETAAAPAAGVPATGAPAAGAPATAAPDLTA